jgi:Septum formation
MAAPVGLSGSVPEPRHPETTDPESPATEPAATEPAATEPAATAPVASQPATAPVASQPAAAEAPAVELAAAVPKAAEPPDAGPDAAPPDAGPQDAGPPDAAPPDAGPQDAGPPDAAPPDAGPDAGLTGQAYGEGADAVSRSDLGAEPEDAHPTERAGRARKARPLAVAATVVGIVALVGVAVAVLAVVTHGFRPKTVVTYRVPAVFSLRPGDCINSAPNGLSATVLSCATPHDAEVFATFGLAGSSWPGSAVVQQEAGSGCVSRIGGYVNPAFAEAGFAQEYVYPDQSAWQAGVRTVICEVRAQSGQLTGSVRKGG